MNRPDPHPGGVDQKVFSTPFFSIVSRSIPESPHPHFIIESPDFATVIALDTEGNLVLVRQYRHGVGMHTLELPSGHVDSGNSPEQTARNELLEETGYVADEFELLGDLSPSTARFSNRIWCFLARNVRPEPGANPEAGVEVVIYRKGLQQLVHEREFCSAAQYGAICLALLSGKLSVR